MATIIPKTSTVLSSLLRADFTTQWRNRRAVVLTLIVPVIILMTWKVMITEGSMGGPFVLANSITIGLFASGLMGYANAIARDRDKGIFQRLRVAPVPSWAIMASRLLVQLAMILMITTAVFVIGKEYDGVTLSPMAYVITYLTSIIGGAVSLSLGQLIVGWIKNPETINSTTRLLYLFFIMAGMLGEIFQKELGETLADAKQYLPYGAVKIILAAGMEPEKWNSTASVALLVNFIYIIVFTTLGIKWFKWNTK